MSTILILPPSGYSISGTENWHEAMRCQQHLVMLCFDGNVSAKAV